MISLKYKENSIHICDIVKKREKPKPVYYYYDVDDSLLSEPDSYASLLKSSLPEIKEKLKVNQSVVDSAIELIQKNKEPDHEASAPIRKAYYFLKKKSRELLREEIDLRDVSERAQVNIPSKLDEWPGTWFVAGSSGSGKGHFVCSTILRHWRTSSPLNRRHVWYVTPELHEDKTLRMISDTKKYEDYFHGIDVSHDTFDKSELSSEEFFNQNIKGILDSQRNVICVFDDCQDAGGNLPTLIRKYVDRLLRTGRHNGTSTWTLQHSLRNSAFSRQAVQSCKHIVLFCRSQRGKCTTFLKDSVGLSLKQSRELVQLMATSSRSAVLRMHSPMALISESFVKLL